MYWTNHHSSKHTGTISISHKVPLSENIAYLPLLNMLKCCLNLLDRMYNFNKDKFRENVYGHEFTNVTQSVIRCEKN